MTTIALRLPTDRRRWITVPPQGYSGIHWVVSNLIDGLLHHGHQVFLLGAPGSVACHPNLTVVPVGEPTDMHAWLATAAVDLVHDHSCGQIDPDRLPRGLPMMSTHHLTGSPSHPRNCVYLSRAQRAAAGSDFAPVIRISVNGDRYRFRAEKDGYLLYIGRVSTFKGTYEAAAFARAAGRRLVIAGPSWEEDYRQRIERDFGDTVEWVGEVGGERRLDLLARASAAMVLSQSVMGLWGGVWCEPGSTVVSEAAACGTPVIATGNGCLSEIVPPVGTIVSEGADFSRAEAEAVLAGLPAPDQVRAGALARWDYREAAHRYEDLYKIVMAGETWV